MVKSKHNGTIHGDGVGMKAGQLLSEIWDVAV